MINAHAANELTDRRDAGLGSSGGPCHKNLPNIPRPCVGWINGEQLFHEVSHVRTCANDRTSPALGRQQRLAAVGSPLAAVVPERVPSEGRDHGPRLLRNARTRLPVECTPFLHRGMEGTAMLKMPALERYQNLNARISFRHVAQKIGRPFLRHRFPPRLHFRTTYPLQGLTQAGRTIPRTWQNCSKSSRPSRLCRPPPS